MLVLSRQRDETIMIGDDIEITIVDIRGDKVRLGITAPTTVPVHRKEVYESIKRENREAARIQAHDMPDMTRPTGAPAAPRNGSPIAGAPAAPPGTPTGHDPNAPVIHDAAQRPRRPKSEATGHEPAPADGPEKRGPSGAGPAVGNANSGPAKAESD